MPTGTNPKVISQTESVKELSPLTAPSWALEDASSTPPLLGFASTPESLFDVALALHH